MAFRARFVGGRPSVDEPSAGGGGEAPRGLTVPLVAAARTTLGLGPAGELEGWESSGIERRRKKEGGGSRN